MSKRKKYSVAEATACSRIIAKFNADQDVNLKPGEAVVAAPANPMPEYIVAKMIRAIGEDPDRDGLRDTPARVAKSWKQLFGGYKEDPTEILSRTFDSDGYDQLVALTDIEFFSFCEHHMLPFYGVAHVGYIPKKGGRVVGLSKLARVVECFARRLQIQERLTQQIGDAVKAALQPRGIGVVVESRHTCMVARGVQKGHAMMSTSYLDGALKRDAAAREEFFSLIRGGRAFAR